MKYKVLKYELSKNIVDVIRGPRLNNCKQTKNENMETVKILNWPNLKKLSEGKSLDNIQESYINMTRKNKKSDMYLKKGDIVIPVFPSENGKNVIYIEKDSQEYIYGELVFVLRINESSIISSEYLYIILSSDSYSNQLLALAEGTRVIRYRLTNEILENLTIPILNDESMKHLIDEYSNIKEMEKELKLRKDEFNNKISQLNNK